MLPLCGRKYRIKTMTVCLMQSNVSFENTFSTILATVVSFEIVGNVKRPENHKEHEVSNGNDNWNYVR